jgi:hypothetical protein
MSIYWSFPVEKLVNTNFSGGNEYATPVFQIQTYWIIVESEVVQVDKNNFRRFLKIIDQKQVYSTTQIYFY